MAAERPGDGGFDEKVARLKLTREVSVRSFDDDRLFQLARLRGDDPHRFDPLFVREDTRSKQFVQAYAVAAMPSVEFEITGRGPEKINVPVGWIRARVTRLFRGHKPRAEIVETYVHPDVPDRAAVLEFLLSNIKEKVRKITTLEGLSVDVPIDSVADVAHYMKHGFVPATEDGSELIWTSDN
jgi:hypothetical protein